MKTLIIGFDGASENTFKRGWTPFIESLIKKGKIIDLKEDLANISKLEFQFGSSEYEWKPDKDLLQKSLNFEE